MATAPIQDPPVQDPPADPPAAPPAPAPANDPPAQDPPLDPAAQDPPADDWRSRIAGDDADLLKFLGRHQSEASFAKEAKQNLADIRSGKYRKPLGDDPSEEDLAAYRKDNGVPEKPEGYLEKLSDGLVVGDDDKPYVDKFLSAMHETNARPADVNAALKTYYAIVEEQSAAAAETEEQAKRNAEDDLRKDWGADYRRNINAIDGYLGTVPEAVKEVLAEGFGPDGSRLGNNAEFLRWLASLALEANPLATVVPGAGANQASAVAEEIASIEKVMREDRPKYNRDEKMQARLRDLYAAREKIK